MNKEIVSEMRFFVDDMTHRNIELLKKNQKLEEKMRALNKDLRKTQERSIKYKNRCLKLNKKIYELKKQLEDMTLCRDIASGHRQEVQYRERLLLNQQKEFIKHLEVEIEFFRSFNLESSNVCKDILDYYKKIIGGK